MTTGIVELSDALLNRENGGSTFQKTVRDFLNEAADVGGMSGVTALQEVASVLGTYRTHAETRIREGETNDEVASLRKVVNNVVGDTVRICREWTGGELTIKCKKKKPEYVYEVQEVEAKSEKSDSSPEPEEAPAPTVEVTADCAAEVEKLIRTHGWDAVVEGMRQWKEANPDAE